MSRGKAEAFGALVEPTFLLLVTLSSTKETGVVISRVRRGKDRVGLVMKCLSFLGTFGGFLGSQSGNPFFVRKRRRERLGSWDDDGDRRCRAGTTEKGI